MSEENTIRLTCRLCGALQVRALPYSMDKPDKCSGCGQPFRTRLDIFMMETKLIRQSWAGSLGEAVVSTGVEWAILLATARGLVFLFDWLFGYHNSGTIGLWMFLCAVARYYLIRRLWNAELWKWRRT